jgi:hypothetical protein
MLIRILKIVANVYQKHYMGILILKYAYIMHEKKYILMAASGLATVKLE